MNLRRSLLVAFLLVLLFYGELPPPATATPVQTSLDIPIEVNKKTSHPGSEIQNLYKFIRQIKTGDEDVLAGIYVAGVMAFPVIQQPPGEPAYVSTQPDTLTQFALANDYGSMGILAHNTLAGAIFNELYPLQRIRLIFGDGSVSEYVISSVERFQALSPTSPFSDFMDLSHPG